MTELKNLLEEMAARTGSLSLPEHDLVQRIRRRRRVRSAVTAASGVAAVAVLAVGAYAALPSDTLGPASTATAASMPTPPYKCGVAFPAPTPGEKDHLAVVVTLTQKSMRRTSTGWSGAIRSKYLYQGGLPHPLVGGLPPKQLAVVENGRMVGRATVGTTSRQVVLQPGQSNVVDARIDVRSCAGEPLPTGAYQLYEDLSETTKASAGQVVDPNPIGEIQLR